MKFCTTLIAVKDMEKSLQFYKNLFRQEVTLDLGWNKTLSCGLTLQEHFDRLAEFPADTMHFRSNTMELYLEAAALGNWSENHSPRECIREGDSARGRDCAARRGESDSAEWVSLM
ncbi:MAG: hypothetical protein HFH88_03285 [Lachnospiraceae bacterium]|nr:hypothetical protein [Lachnospiraceae bacterium]